jgi:serine/threonine-protein kinase RsbW
MQLSLPRDARFVGLMRHVSASILDEFQAPDDRSHEFQVALSEACANAVQYAEGTHDYTVKLALADDRCEVEVIDLGPGFDPAGGGDGPALDAESGRGLLLMQALSDDFEFERVDDGTRIRLVKRFPGLVMPA